MTIFLGIISQTMYFLFIQYCIYQPIKIGFYQTCPTGIFKLERLLVALSSDPSRMADHFGSELKKQLYSLALVLP